MKTAVLFLFALACCASTVDPNQVYASNGVSFHWVLEDGRGYVAEDWQGDQISGLNFGFTPWLDIDSPGIQPPACCEPEPPIPPNSPRVTVTPEPGTWGTGLLVLLILAVHIRPRSWTATLYNDQNEIIANGTMEGEFDPANFLDSLAAILTRAGHPESEPFRVHVETLEGGFWMIVQGEIITIL